MKISRATIVSTIGKSPDVWKTVIHSFLVKLQVLFVWRCSRCSERDLYIIFCTNQQMTCQIFKSLVCICFYIIFNWLLNSTKGADSFELGLEN